MTALGTAPPPPRDEPLLAIACPGCHAALAAPAGGPARCPLCLSGFMVPAAPRPRPAAAAEAKDEAEIRRLSREERAVRRGRRNMVMLFSGVFVLMALVLILGTRRARRRR